MEELDRLQMNHDLLTLLDKARERVAAMSASERAGMLRAQRRSYVLAEAGFGSDADEAMYAKAVHEEDINLIRYLDDQAARRVRLAETALDAMGL